ncbi:MAG: hypothetical protein PHU14_08390 [Methylovulum sp.]|nr:hypothetical protein [Methylovulum sp.]
MSFPFRIHIHLGAHKTATTFIQNNLARQQPWLREQQIAYIPLATLRQHFTPSFWALTQAQTADQAALIGQLCATLLADIHASGFDPEHTRLLVLSEENLLGALGSLNHKGVLYPELAKRMQLLAQVFAGCDVQAFLAIRNYRDFYASAYAETLRQGHIKPLERFVGGLDLSGNSWLTVVAAVEAALGPVALWPYEQFRHHAPLILGNLLQTEVTPDRIGQHIARPSLTRKGLAVAMASRGGLSATEMKKLVNLLIDKMVFEQPDGRIAMAEGEVVERLDAQYQAELEVLAGKFMVGIPL